MVTKPDAPSNNRARYGQAGEAFAQNLIERSGYRIVDTNVRFGKTSGLIGELDIVAWDGATLCFIEVKARRDRPGAAPAEAVTPAKQRQIARLALAYASRHGLLADEETPLRFDVVTVWFAERDGDIACRGRILRGAFLAPDDL